MGRTRGAVEAAKAFGKLNPRSGEPDALKGACPVREGAVGNGSFQRNLERYRAGRLLHFIQALIGKVNVFI
jgi:hypothetical protein